MYNADAGGSATVNFPSTSTSVTRNTATVGGGIFNLGTLGGYYLVDVNGNTGGNIAT